MTTTVEDTHRCAWCDAVLDPVVRHAQRHAHDRGRLTVRSEDIRAAERETGMTIEIAR